MSKYKGKITKVGRKYLTAVLWIKDEEVVADIDRNIFPSAGYHIGQIFNYSYSSSKSRVSVTYELVKPKTPTAKELIQLRKSVERELKGLDTNL